MRSRATDPFVCNEGYITNPELPNEEKTLLSYDKKTCSRPDSSLCFIHPLLSVGTIALFVYP